MFKNWKWLGAGLTALLVSGLVSTTPTSEAKRPKPPKPPAGPITISPEPGVVLTWVGPESWWDHAHAGFLDSNNNIVVAGSKDSSHGFAVLRYTPLGTLDTTFGDGGVVTTSLSNWYNAAWAAAPNDGKIVLAGYAKPGPYKDSEFALARYKEDGGLDKKFGRNGKVTTHVGRSGSATGVVVQQDGKIVAAGSNIVSGTAGFTLARYTATGNLDPTFGGTGIVHTQIGERSESTNALVMHPLGLLAVGVARDYSSTNFALARYNLDGNLDSSFGGGTGIVTSAFSTEDQADAAAVNELTGEIVVAGNVKVPSNPGTAVYDWAVARYHFDGTPDTVFGGTGLVLTDVTGYERAHAVAIREDGKIVSAGFANVPNEGYQFAVLRHMDDGSLDVEFGIGGKVLTPILDHAVAQSVIIQPDGKIVAIGVARDFDAGVKWIAMARYTEDGTLDESFGPQP